ncbi:MAG: hypothetical protein ACLQRH_17090 [Acidimicrobiales bacterium]
MTASESVNEDASGQLLALVEELVGRVEVLYADVAGLKSGRPASTSAGVEGQTRIRTLPSQGEPVDLAVLAEWVDSLMARYAAAGDWLRPCWWRHGFVIEELAALHTAWLGVYDARQPVDSAAGIRWHDEAERCRDRVRRTIAAGPACSAVSHKPDEAVTEDSRWTEELAALHEQIARDARCNGDA